MFRYATLLTVTVALLAGGAVASADIVARYEFEDNLDDSYPNNLDGDYGTWSGGNFTGGGTPGYVSDPAYTGAGKAVALTAAADAIDLSNSSLLNPTGELTFAAWVKTNSSGSNYVPIARYGWGGSDQDAYEIHINNTSSFKATVVSSDNTFGGPSSISQNVMDGTWNHLAVTADTAVGGKVTVYLNGVFQAEDGSLAGKTLATSPLRTFLGSGSYDATLGANMDGWLDDVVIFNHALTVDEIGNIMDGDFSAYPIPEPSSIVLLASGLLALVLIARRRRR